ncbi:MAG: tRNA 2-thiouridine(34) synthase MnmA [Desulfobacterales bacterium]|uniref:tRNA-specific 2-thiouridylase MnmA n=1 Tax=Candidatus Desulfaltia bathyphila TaxID=2841697 RepID=A0A8J6N6D5_9BACT|nr:tRNA 2-thiouridine(34) synthase MnmA [Candidatus Desulfaltia bathyphila]MBL7194864.1 tRNA 2-thiouridine(34) synthase MnmA [Desulfobacterales bacterium]MBL7207527.1 tRNA 2-thiouridine(34) synthase MnmA [Desulfobacterales bacterium]
MKQLTAIAISGGIDSLVAAYLLKKQGRKVIGIHFTTGYEPEPEPVNIISHIADNLNIKIEILDCRKEFKQKVVDYFIQSYLTGQTPNPCIVCNLLIKFGTVLEFARRLGASCLATGHYAQTTKDKHGRFHLLKGVDLKKDQSYFLAFMSQEQLAHACFPLGMMTKTEVIKLAKEHELDHFIKQESQDICFIKGKTYGDFIALQKSLIPQPGLIEDIDGNIIGKHKGLHLFTIGQRRGIDLPASEPYYVVRIDRKQNRLVVGFKDSLITSECRVAGINWIDKEPTSSVKVYTRLRYRHKPALSTLFPDSGNKAIVRFESPQSAITPGQGAVFYNGNKVLGGGWITSGE